MALSLRSRDFGQSREEMWSVGQRGLHKHLPFQVEPEFFTGLRDSAICRRQSFAVMVEAEVC